MDSCIRGAKLKYRGTGCANGSAMPKQVEPK